MKKEKALKRAKRAIKWIDSLSTTKLKQGRDKLGSVKSGFCCLGLGCELLKISYNDDEANSDIFAKKIGLFDEDGLSSSIMIWKGGSRMIKIASLILANDNYKLTFEEISHLIKDNLKLLFKPKVATILVEHYDVKK